MAFSLDPPPGGFSLFENPPDSPPLHPPKESRYQKKILLRPRFFGGERGRRETPYAGDPMKTPLFTDFEILPREKNCDIILGIDLDSRDNHNDLRIPFDHKIPPSPVYVRPVERGLICHHQGNVLPVKARESVRVRARVDTTSTTPWGHSLDEMEQRPETSGLADLVRV